MVQKVSTDGEQMYKLKETSLLIRSSPILTSIKLGEFILDDDLQRCCCHSVHENPSN